MTILTVDEIFESFVQRIGQNRVHQQQRVPFIGQPGHVYFVSGRMSNEHLAQITYRSRNAEVALIKINDAYIISIGNVGVASSRIFVPPEAARRQGVEEYRWIAHTHPLEQSTEYAGIARGPTGTDRNALEQIHNRGWRQDQSEVVVCRGGRVVNVVSFRREPTLSSRSRGNSLRSFRVEP